MTGITATNAFTGTPHSGTAALSPGVATFVTGASQTLAASTVYLAALDAQLVTGSPADLFDLTGCNTTWTPIARNKLWAASLNRLQLYIGVTGASPTSTPLTWNSPTGSLHSSARYSLTRLGGVVVSSGALRTAGESEGAGTGTAGSANVLAPPALGNARNGRLFFWVSKATGTWTTDTTPVHTLVSQAQNNQGKLGVTFVDGDDAAPTITFNASQFWALVGLEPVAVSITDTVHEVSLVVTVLLGEGEPDPDPEPVPDPGGPPPVEDTGGPSDVQAANARPWHARSMDPVEMLRHTMAEVQDMKGKMAASFGGLPVYTGADPVNPPESYVWLRSDTGERCTRLGGVTRREAL